MVPQPLPAHRAVRRHELLVGRLQAVARSHGPAAQHGALLHEVDEPDDRDGQVLAGGAGAVPRAARPVGVRDDQGRAREQAAGEDRAARHGVLRRVLRVPRRPGQGLHHPRLLLHRAGHQGARPQGRRRGLEELHEPDAGAEAQGWFQVDVPDQVSGFHGVA